MKATNPVGLDSQCLSYLVDAMSGISAPCGDLAIEKISLLRAYLYTTGTLYVTATVKSECSRIRNEGRRDTHESFMNVLFGEWPVENQTAVDIRTLQLEAIHPKENDCRIFAEAEEVGISALLSYDNRFISRLSGESPTLRMMRPSEFWLQLQIPKGAPPDKLPHDTNPLYYEDWWRW